MESSRPKGWCLRCIQTLPSSIILKIALCLYGHLQRSQGLSGSEAAHCAFEGPFLGLLHQTVSADELNSLATCGHDPQPVPALVVEHNSLRSQMPLAMAFSMVPEPIWLQLQTNSPSTVAHPPPERRRSSRRFSSSVPLKMRSHHPLNPSRVPMVRAPMRRSC